MNKSERKKYVYSRSGKSRGRCTGGEFPCRLDGCMGRRIAVRWPSGRMTYPCTGGMKVRKDGNWEIV